MRLLVYFMLEIMDCILYAERLLVGAQGCSPGERVVCCGSGSSVVRPRWVYPVPAPANIHCDFRLKCLFFNRKQY